MGITEDRGATVMINLSRRKLAGFVGVLALVTVSVATAGPAMASSDSSFAPDASVPDRVIDLSSERVPWDYAALAKVDDELSATPTTHRSTSQTTSAVLGGAVPLPEGAQLRVGETLQVNYSDGIVVHQAVTAACTATSSVSNPYKSGSAGRADHSYGLSSGCPGNTSVNAILSSFAAPWWHQRDFKTVSVIPGTTSYWGTTRTCVNSNSTTWHAENAVGSSSISLSSNVNIACNPG